MKYPFQIFGSPSSVDYDLMIFVPAIPSLAEAKAICLQYDRELYLYLGAQGWPLKKVNANLAVVSGGHVVDVFKGTVDEVNNSMYWTYLDHAQLHPQKITHLIPRDVDCKNMRTARVLLSFLARTVHRREIKRALHGDFIHRLDTLNQLDLSLITDLGTRNTEWVDYVKTMAFQLGQTLGLNQGIELYTKEEIARQYPRLHSMLFRCGEDLRELEQMKADWINLCQDRLPSMKTFIEYK